VKAACCSSRHHHSRHYHARLNADAGEQIKQKLPAVKLVYLTMNAAAEWRPKLSGAALRDMF